MTATADALVFDPIEHSYTLARRRLPYITQILSLYGIMYVDPNIPAHVLEFARDRGSAVHLGIRFANEGRLDATSVAPQIEPYLWAWEGFCAAHAGNFVPQVVEQPMFHPELGFAGTPDAIGLWHGVGAVVEVKTCATMPPGAAVQTAAQRLLANANGHRVIHRLGVQLKPDGTFRLHEYRDPLDAEEFRAALLLASRRIAREGRLESWTR
jgi:hypothetical protein